MSISLVGSYDSNYSVGRANIDSLPQQALMELFIEGIENSKLIREAGKVISEWKGVTLNQKREVIGIDWRGMNLKGKVMWKYLPGSIEEIFLGSEERSMSTGWLKPDWIRYEWNEVLTITNSLEGEIDFSALPINLRKLDIEQNRFTGTLRLDELPKNMQRIILNDNPEIKGKLSKREIFECRGFLTFRVKNTQIEVVD